MVNAAMWYESQQEGLGKRYLTSVQDALNRVQRAARILSATRDIPVLPADSAHYSGSGVICLFDFAARRVRMIVTVKQPITPARNDTTSGAAERPLRKDSFSITRRSPSISGKRSSVIVEVGGFESPTAEYDCFRPDCSGRIVCPGNCRPVVKNAGAHLFLCVQSRENDD